MYGHIVRRARAGGFYCDCADYKSSGNDECRHIRALLAADPCVKLAIDKYTPSAAELRDWDEMNRAAEADAPFTARDATGV